MNFNDQTELLADQLFLRKNEVDELNKTVRDKSKTINYLTRQLRLLETKTNTQLRNIIKRQELDLDRQKRELLRVKLELCELKKRV